MTIDRRLLAGALGCVLLVAACGGSSASATPSAAAATPAAASQPALSLDPGNATDLSAMIPSTVGDLTLQKTSFDYSTIPWASISGFFNQGDLDTILKSHGKTAADIRFAMAIGMSGATLPTQVFAFQIRGVPAGEFVDQFDSSYSTSDKTTLGGKSVAASFNSGVGEAAYVHDDIVFLAIGSQDVVTSIVQQLP
jgi:hypothetical protein